MKHYRLSAAQRAANHGYTDLFVISKADLTTATDNTAQAVTLTALVAGDVVYQDALLDVVSAWTGPSDLTATVSIGVTASATAITAALTLVTAGTAAAAGTAALSPTQTNAPYVASTGINVIATFTPDADSAVSDFTAGELLVWLKVNRRAERKTIAA